MRDMHIADRPRERIAARGADTLSNVDLVAAIIGSGIKGRDVRVIARDVCLLLGNGRPLPGYEDLSKVPGMGKVHSAQISAAFELARRLLCKPTGIRIHQPEDAEPLLAFLREKHQEHFVVITLNGAGDVIHCRTVTIGTLNQSLVHPREVFADAVTDRAASVICAHNHPSGTREPSTEDIAITRQLRDAGGILGIRLLDHLIVTRDGLISLREQGIF